MNVGALSLAELYRRLRTDGVYLRAGPFVCHIFSPLGDVAEALRFGYHDYPQLDRTAFADFHVQIVPYGGLRRWVFPQAIFTMDTWRPIKPFPRALAAAWMEWGLNWCVAAHAHQYLMIHAAVVERGGRAVILPAGSGAGKSTLCAGLVLSGWRLLSDELALVRPEDGLLVPLPRPVSLKNESIGVIEQFSAQAKIGRRWGGTSKGTVAHMRPPVESVHRADEPARPAWIVFPSYDPTGPTRSRRCSKGSAFMELASRSVNYRVLGARGFDVVTRLIDRCDCYEFRYAQLGEAVARFDTLPSPQETTSGPTSP